MCEAVNSLFSPTFAAQITCNHEVSMRISVVLSTVMLLCVLALPTFSQQPTQHAFLWSRTSGMQDLGSLGGSSYALALNSSGEVVGYFVTTLGDLRAFLWTANGGMQDIGKLGGAN